MRAAFFVSVLLASFVTTIPASHGGTLDLTGELSKEREKLQQQERRIERDLELRRMERQRRAREQDARNRAVFDETMCWTIKNENARYACLNRPYLTKNKDARNILLGYCHDLSEAANKAGLREVCHSGENACFGLKDSNLTSSCASCGGSKRWAATAVSGTIFRCFIR